MQIKDRDITAMMFAILQNAMRPPESIYQRIAGTFDATIAGRNFRLLIADPMVNRIPAAIMSSNDWTFRCELPKNWPQHAHLTKEDGHPKTIFQSKSFEGNEAAMARDITLMKVFV